MKMRKFGRVIMIVEMRVVGIIDEMTKAERRHDLFRQELLDTRLEGWVMKFSSLKGDLKCKVAEDAEQQGEIPLFQVNTQWKAQKKRGN